LLDIRWHQLKVKIETFTFKLDQSKVSSMV
jgi:hypothetical protein